MFARNRENKFTRFKYLSFTFDSFFFSGPYCISSGKNQVLLFVSPTSFPLKGYGSFKMWCNETGKEFYIFREDKIMCIYINQCSSH